MPIRPENRNRYPSNWKEIRARILARAKDHCEFCAVANYSMISPGGGRVVLTIAHLNHTPEDNRDENLRALCQKCHNKYDAEHRAETRRKTRDALSKQLRLGDL